MNDKIAPIRLWAAMTGISIAGAACQLTKVVPVVVFAATPKSKLIAVLSEVPTALFGETIVGAARRAAALPPDVNSANVPDFEVGRTTRHQVGAGGSGRSRPIQIHHRGNITAPDCSQVHGLFRKDNLVYF
jgi:hypothetical protein